MSRLKRLARENCFAGANFGARTTFDASVGIDVIDITFRDCLYGANGKTCAASDAFVSNNVSHSCLDNFCCFIEVVCECKCSSFLQIIKFPQSKNLLPYSHSMVAGGLEEMS